MLSAFEANPIATGFWIVIAGFTVVVFTKLVGFIFMRGQTVHRIGDHMAGQIGQVSEWDGDCGLVSVSGEVWKAASKNTLNVGDDIIVLGIKGLTLKVAGKK